MRSTYQRHASSPIEVTDSGIGNDESKKHLSKISSPIELTQSIHYNVNDVSKDYALKVSLLIELTQSAIVNDESKEHLSKKEKYIIELKESSIVNDWSE